MMIDKAAWPIARRQRKDNIDRWPRFVYLKCNNQHILSDLVLFTPIGICMKKKKKKIINPSIGEYLTSS